LFVIYINDLPDLIAKFAQVSLFEQALQVIYDWLEEGLLMLNISKCKALSLTIEGYYKTMCTV